MDEQVDRLSTLPNDLIHLILSFIDIKDAIKTIALSSRYRFIWTSLPYLNFSNEDFWTPYKKLLNEDLLTLPKFSKFVSHVLSRRDTQIQVYSVKLSFRGKISHVAVKSILNYAFSHNVQQMTVTYMADWNDRDFPLSLFSSQSLKHLTLSGVKKRDINPSSTWELPALTTLHLNYITFIDVFTHLFSKCLNLKNLSLNDCDIHIRGPVDVDICHPGLSNLTLENWVDFFNVLNVVTPQLKNLTISKCSQVHLLSAPKLDSLVFKGYHIYILQCSPNGLCSLEKADLCFYKPDYDYDEGKLDESYAHKVVDLLRQVRSVKYLTLNMETIQLLSSFKELISHQPSPFTNLKSLKVYPHDALSKMEEIMPIEVKNYFLETSSGATFTMVSCKEIIALRNALSVQNRMTNTSPLDSHDTKMHEKGEAQFENEKAHPVKKKQLDIEGRMARIKICWKDLGPD